MKARNKKSTYAAVERNVGHAREKLGIKWFQLLIAVLTITFCFGMGGHAAASEDWTWVNAKPDHIPPDAVYGGQEGQQSLYICRAGYQNGIHPGKVRPGFGGCNIAYGGAEVTVPNFQILVSSWVPSANGSVPPGASAFGNEAADAGKLPLFVCRAAHNGIHPGKVRPGLGGCNIAYGGAEITASTFWDLLHPRWIPNDDNIHGAFFEAGKEADGSALYICRAIPPEVGGVHPGKFRPGLGGCNIGWGGKEFTVGQYQVLGRGVLGKR